MTWLNTATRRLLGRATDRAPVRGLVLDRPGAAVYAVGDVHGRLDLYKKLEDRIQSDADRTSEGPALVILLGDMVDRGPDSARLLELLCAPPPAGIERHCLLGNHEAMALEFLTKPDPTSSWLDFGGTETLMSYGIPPDRNGAYRLAPARMRARIAAHIPDDHLRLLASLPHYIRVGGHFFSHAGPDAALSPEDQTERQLLWSVDFAAPPGAPPAWLGEGLAVQGHIVVDAPTRNGWKLGIDTGAYATGRLSAVRLVSGEEFRAITVSEHE